jgi:hypothetical protein
MMSNKPRKRYTEEFKAQAVELEKVEIPATPTCTAIGIAI